MTEKTVSSFDEWDAMITADPFAESDDDERRIQATGELGAQIRERVGSKHAAPYLIESGVPCPCKNCVDDPDRFLTIECGDFEIELGVDGNRFADALSQWLGEPRRLAEERARKAAEQQAATEQALAVVQAQETSIFDAMQTVETEGYRNDREWHDKLMNKLGVKGY